MMQAGFTPFTGQKVMKRLMLGGLLLLSVARLASGQASSFVNTGSFNAPPATPPNIDATHFENDGSFNLFLDFTGSAANLGYGGFLFTGGVVAPFDFSDVDYYTNRGTMSCDAGFIFNYNPSTSGFSRPSASFGNANSGQILAGSANSPFVSGTVFFGTTNDLVFLPSLPLMTIQASNIVNSGLLDVGTEGLLTVTGNDVNLKRGTLHVEGFDDTNLVTVLQSSLGIFDVFTGIGNQTNVLFTFATTNSFPGNLTVPAPTSPQNRVTNTAALTLFDSVAPNPGVAFANVNLANPSNLCIQVVYINTNLPGISTSVRFDPNSGSLGFALPVIQWEAAITNKGGVFGASVITNDLYLSDQFG